MTPGMNGMRAPIMAADGILSLGIMTTMHHSQGTIALKTLIGVLTTLIPVKLVNHSWCGTRFSSALTGRRVLISRGGRSQPLLGSDPPWLIFFANHYVSSLTSVAPNLWVRGVPSTLSGGHPKNLGSYVGLSLPARSSPLRTATRRLLPRSSSSSFRRILRLRPHSTLWKKAMCHCCSALDRWRTFILTCASVRRVSNFRAKLLATRNVLFRSVHRDAWWLTSRISNGQALQRASWLTQPPILQIFHLHFQQDKRLTTRLRVMVCFALMIAPAILLVSVRHVRGSIDHIRIVGRASILTKKRRRKLICKC